MNAIKYTVLYGVGLFLGYAAFTVIEPYSYLLAIIAAAVVGYQVGYTLTPALNFKK